MSDYMARGQDLERKADKKLNAWNLFGSKYDDAVELLHNSANSYKLAKSWDKAGSVFIKLSKCHLKLESKHEAAAAYVDAARCYKKTSAKGAISCLHQAISLYTEIGKYSMAARYCKELGDLYELDQDIENAALCFDRAAEFFDLADTTSSANQCKLKVAEFSALLQQYQKAIDIFEDIAQQSLNNNLLKYGVRGHLLNAGLCQICQGDIVAITKSLERYQDLDPTFSRVREYKLLAGLASAIDEEDVEKFTEEVKEFDSITPLDSWKTTLLLRAKQALKAKEMEEDDLT